MRFRALTAFAVLLVPASIAVAQPASQAKPARTGPTPGVEAPAPRAVDNDGVTVQKPESDAMPATVIFDKPATGVRMPSTAGDPLFEPPPLPKGDVSLIGGVVRGIDRVRNRIDIQPFSGKSMTVHFDDRTHIYRDGVETTQLGIRKGDRVYVDTMLDKSFVLARNVRVMTEFQPGDARGQLVQIDDRRQVMVLQDGLSKQPVAFRVDSRTVVKKGGNAGLISDLAPGALVSVRFAADKGNRNVAREVTVYAMPGAVYTFAGDITHLDVATGTLAIHNFSDDKSYEIAFDRSMTAHDLQLGAQATIQAQFTGRNYKASQIQVTQAAAKEQ